MNVDDLKLTFGCESSARASAATARKRAGVAKCDMLYTFAAALGAALSASFAQKAFLAH